MRPSKDVDVIAPSNIEELAAHVGQEVGASGWQTVTQDDVDRFAGATGDHQWIHTDVDRARQTEFGGTIAHGFYTLSLAPKLLAELVSFEDFAFAMNYGLNRVRFVSPLPVGDRVRMRARLDAVEPRAGGASLTASLTFERAGDDKPVCVAEFLIHLQP
jgi:acyl dehydratase